MNYYFNFDDNPISLPHEQVYQQPPQWRNPVIVTDVVPADQLPTPPAPKQRTVYLFDHQLRINQGRRGLRAYNLNNEYQVSPANLRRLKAVLSRMDMTIEFEEDLMPVIYFHPARGF